MLFGSGGGDDGDDDDVLIYLLTYAGYNIPKTAASPERQPTPLGTTTVPRPPHISALGVPGKRMIDRSWLQMNGVAIEAGGGARCLKGGVA